MPEQNQKKPKQVVPDKPAQSPDLPPGARGNQPPIQPKRITRQTDRDLAKKPANQSQI